MDCDSELVAKLLYADGIPEKWKDNPEFYHYINKLGGYSVEQLSKEPTLINSEKASVINQTQELGFANYKTFIHTAECSRRIFDKFNRSEECLDSLIEKMPNFSSKCEEFMVRAKELKAQRRLTSVCLARHSSVLHVLEALQLMETVIREGMYEEALRLAAFVRRLANAHPNIPVLQNMLGEVERCWWVLVGRLLSQLSGDLQLPRCLQLMAHLRRMDVLSPQELKLKFLQARDQWLSSQLAAVPTDDASVHLSRVIEVSRNQLFNIVTQYRAVFTEDDSHVLSRQPLCDMPILQAWINHKIDQFVCTVERDLEQGVGSALPSLMSQCMYLGQSLGRVGADPRPLLAPLFLNTIRDNFSKQMTRAAADFTQDMGKFQLSNICNIPFKSPTDEQKHPCQVTPPSALLEFYPLSVCCNNILVGLNELRLCAPLSLAQSTTTALSDALLHISNTILDFYLREQQALTKEEKEVFSKLCLCYAEQLFPYMQKCLHTIYPPLEISTYLGVSVHQIQQEGLTFLNEKSILEPVAHLLPPSQVQLTKLAALTSLAHTPPLQPSHPVVPSELGQPTLHSAQPSLPVVGPPVSSDQAVEQPQSQTVRPLEEAPQQASPSLSVLDFDAPLSQLLPPPLSPSPSSAPVPNSIQDSANNIQNLNSS